MKPPLHIAARRFASVAAFSLALLASAHARTWTSADGTKTFEGDLQAYDPDNGMVAVKLRNGISTNDSQ